MFTLQNQNQVQGRFYNHFFYQVLGYVVLITYIFRQYLRFRKCLQS